VILAWFLPQYAVVLEVDDISQFIVSK
ncbi:MAG: hypothetical protein ACJAVV_002175, partial [Alphaproteobacteria bacterium]